MSATREGAAQVVGSPQQLEALSQGHVYDLRLPPPGHVVFMDNTPIINSCDLHPMSQLYGPVLA